jgi:hypothetical protein
VPRRLLVPRVDAAQDQADTVVETGGNPHPIHSLPEWILYQRRRWWEIPSLLPE